MSLLVNGQHASVPEGLEPITYSILCSDKRFHLITPSSVGNAISVCNGYLTDKELLSSTPLKREKSALSCVISHSRQVVTASVE